MHVFSRSRKAKAESVLQAVPEAVSIAEKVTSLTGLEIYVWQARFGQPLGTLMWSCRLESQAQLFEATEKMLADAGVELTSSDDARVVLTGSIARFDVEERSEGSTFEVAAADVRFSAELAATENGAPRTVLSGEYSGRAVSHPALDATQEQRYMLADAISQAVGALLDEPELWRALGMTRR